jgi:hypothetical protein
VGESAKKTLLAALLAWLLARVLRRLIAVALLATALLAGALAIAKPQVDLSGVARIMRCETHAIVRTAKQLRDGASTSGSQPAGQRQLHALRRLGHCHPRSPAHRRELPRP